MEIKNNNTKTVQQIIQENLQLFYKLSAVGIKNINTALDYYIIIETYKKYKWIQNSKERKEVTAEHLKVSIKSVENALHLMNKNINLNP